MNNRITALCVQLYLHGSFKTRISSNALFLLRACFLSTSFFYASLILPSLALAQTFQTKAPQALLLDFNTGTILYSKSEHTKIPPASLAKLMTMEVIFKRLKDGNLSLDDKFLVSNDSWKRGGSSSGGSTMFAKLNSEITLENLIRGVIIQSANDGAMVIAEGLAGSELAFSNIMNERAKIIGMNNSNFKNATGLPAKDQYVSIFDMAILAKHLITEYPEFYKYYAERTFTWNKIKQHNRNPLLAMSIGADGFKTGYTKQSGYAIVGSAKQGDRRLIAVLSGMKSKIERAEEARKILDWGFRAFEKLDLFYDDDVIAKVGIYGGNKSEVGVVGGGNLQIFLPVGSRARVKARVAYNYPLKPPIKKGDNIATLKIWVGDDLTQESPLYAVEGVAKGGIIRQSTDAFQELLTGWIPN